MTTDRARRIRRAGRAGADVALGVLAVVGAICGLSFLAGLLLQLSVVLFATGSMAPAIPAGSVAVVQGIPASAVRIGEVVTVDRPGELPVTHRVVSVRGTGATRTLRLKGDANPAPDATPYTVGSVRIVRASVPGLAPVVVWFREPLVLGGLTLVAAAIVVWAFWPRSRRMRAAATVIVVVAGAGAVTLGPAAPARADTVGASQHLRLTSRESPEMAALEPGVTADWIVQVETIDPPGPGRLHVGLGLQSASGGTASLRVSLLACAVPFAGGGCASGSRTWLDSADPVSATSPATAYGARELGSAEAGPSVWMLVRVARPDASAGPIALGLRLQVWAFGDAASTGPTELTATGPAPVLIPATAAGCLVLAGAALRLLHRRRR